MKNTAIKIQNLSKVYKLGEIGSGTLRADLQSWIARKRGKEDPNLRIGQSYLKGDYTALDNINLEIEKGETVGIIGLNGAGKSTLLKLISRITSPSTGTIDIYGRVSSMLEVGTGFNGQMTGRENIYMNGAILGMSNKEIAEKIEEIIDFSECREFIDTPVKRYSSGMFVKLAFAVAAFLNNEIIIMDEVLAVGDMAFQKKCIEKMKELQTSDNKTILYVSHNMSTVRQLCDRCIVLKKGKVIFDGLTDTAISIYMDSAIGDETVDIDLSLKEHNKRRNDILTMTHLLLKDKTIPVYGSGDDLDIHLDLDIKEKIKDLVLRITLRNELDIAIGTYFSKPQDINETGTVSLDYKIPLNQVAKGNYYISIGFVKMNELGVMASFDHITRAFKIEVETKNGIRFWNNNAYGYFVMNDKN